MKQNFVQCQYGTRSNKHLKAKLNTGSSNSTDHQDFEMFQQKLILLQQRQKGIAGHYFQKICQLQNILSKQAQTKSELTKQLDSLSKEGLEHRKYLEKIKLAYNDRFSFQKSISHKEINVITSDYMILPKNVKQGSKPDIIKGGMSSEKLNNPIQKYKSQSKIRLKSPKNRIGAQNISKFTARNNYIRID